MHQRPALDAGEYCLVDLFPELLVASENEAATRAAQGFVRGRGHDIGAGDGAGVLSRGNESRDVGHVNHEDGIDAFGDGGDALKVDDARIRRCTRNDHARMMLGGEFFEGIVVDALGLTVDSVGDDFVVAAGDVDGAAVREVSAVREIHAEDGVARLQEREEYRHIRLCARVGLNVRPRRTEKFLRTVNGKLLRNIDILTAAVVTLSWIALGVLVCENTPLRLHDGTADDVLRSNELEFRPLAVQLVIDRLCNLRVCLVQRIHNTHLCSPLPVFFLLERHDFIDTACMAAALERSAYPCAHDLSRRADTCHAPPHGKDVRVVVLARHDRRIDVGTECGADAVDLVCRDGDADSRAAEDDAAIRLAGNNVSADFLRDVGIVHRLFAKGADIRHLDVTEFVKHHLDFFFEIHGSMIAANRNVHELLLLCMYIRPYLNTIQ